MTALLTGIARAIFRLLLLAAGVLFVASVMVAILIAVLFWALRAAWAVVTGRPVTPFAMRMSPRAGWQRVYRYRQSASTEAPTTGEAPRGPRAALGDVTDVEPKEPRG